MHCLFATNCSEMGIEMRYQIVTDSGCDLKSIAKWDDAEIGFTRVPLKIEVGSQEFTDSADLNIDEMLNALDAYKGKTGSAAPGPGEWAEAFEKADVTFALALTSALSGSWSSAHSAKDMVLEEHPEKKIIIFDTRSAGPEISLLARRVVDDIKAGLRPSEIVNDIREYKNSTRLYFVLEHMDNLVKNGRVSHLAGGLAGLLGIQIVACASPEGTIKQLHKCRGKKAALDKLLSDIVEEGYFGGRVMISHCKSQSKAEALRSGLLSLFPGSDISIMEASGLCSYYAEKQGLLVGFETRVQYS